MIRNGISLLLIVFMPAAMFVAASPVTGTYTDDTTMKPEAFITAYEQALASQDWSAVEPLVHRDACVTFSNGSVHEGRQAVGEAFSRNFALIKSERYAIANVRWIRKTPEFAVYLFDFEWTGIINSEQASGNGRGTAVLIFEDGAWKLLTEHLGPKPK